MVWRCSVCNYPNPDDRDECFKCGEAKYRVMPQIDSSSQGQLARPTQAFSASVPPQPVFGTSPQIRQFGDRNYSALVWFARYYAAMAWVQIILMALAFIGAVIYGVSHENDTVTGLAFIIYFSSAIVVYYSYMAVAHFIWLLLNAAEDIRVIRDIQESKQQTN